MHRASIAWLVCVFACACALFAPLSALAADGAYSIDELSTDITVETNGSAHVIERQTYTFGDECLGCIWYLHVPESGESVRISSIRVMPVDDGGTPIGDWTKLQAVDVNRRNQGERPGDIAASLQRTTSTRPWYSYSIGDGMVRCWFPTDLDDSVGPRRETSARKSASTETDATNTYVIETDYTIAHRVRIYNDVSELYWRYANSSLPVDAHDVNLHITLPVAADSGPIAANETIVAWGHGPDEGTFAIGEDGSVSYHVDRIERGNYAEAHVIFPASWTDNASATASNVFPTNRRNAAIAEEAQWVDSSTRGENWDNGVRIVFLCTMLVVLLFSFGAVMRNGRSPRSRHALIRAAATLAIMALGENLFFREPLTTTMLVAAALIVGIVALWLPTVEEETDERTPETEALA